MTRTSAVRAAAESVSFPGYITNAKARQWIGDMVALCKPDAVHFVDGSDEENELLCAQMVAAGVLIKLDPNLRPNS